MENQQMGMSPEMSAPAVSPDQLAIFDQMRQQISPQEFTNEMLAGGAQVDPQAVSGFTQALDGLNMPPEILSALNDMVDAILAQPENYQEMRQKFIKEGVPENLLPEQFDPQFFAALNMAVDQMIGEPTGVQAFAHGGIAELKPIAKAIASYGRNGDTMLAHITPAEARMLRRRGGSGTTNPDTGLPEFFDLFKEIGNAFKSVGDAISGAVNGVVNAVKAFASSTVGKLITTVALGFFLGPAAASFLGVTSSIGVAAVSGFVGSAGATLAGGGSFSDALKAGAVGGITGGIGSGIMGGSLASGSYTGPTTIGGQFDKFTNAIGFGEASAAPAPVPTSNLSADALNPNAPNALNPNAAPVPVTPYDAATATRAKDFGVEYANATPLPAGPSTYSGVPTVSDSFSKIGRGIGLGDGSASFSEFTEGVGDLFAPSSPSAESINARAADLVAKSPQLPFTEAIKQATKELTPGMLRTYGPAAVAGLGALSAFGGFEQTPVEGGPITASLQKTPVQRMREEGSERENYLQSMPGVKYNEKGEPIYGESTPLPTYTSPGFAPPSSTGYASAAAPANKGMYTPPPGSLTNSAGGVYQPYNNSNMYQNMYPSLYPGMNPGMGQNIAPRRAAEGGIAALRSGGYPRRTGQISGPGTEKSDDIPAMLSDGEFVMTAAAVRGAGKGNRRDGAKRMYKLMHQLEKNSERG